MIHFLLILQLLPVAEGSETSPSEEENDKDSIEDDADEKGDADDDFQEHKNKNISIEIIKVSIGNIVKFIVSSEISQTFRLKL